MADPSHVLIVDDEPQIRLLLRRTLERVGYRVDEAGDARGAIDALVRNPAVVLLDLGLPDRDGLELIGPLRANGAALLVLTARDAVEDKVAALDLGADDYVTKPFDTLELLARVRTALRHRGGPVGPAASVLCGEVSIDLALRRVRQHGVDVHLSPKEYAVLAELARAGGRVLTHAQIIRAVWGPAHDHDLEYLRVTVRGIRRKLNEAPESSIIRNEPAVGYRLLVD